MRPKRVGLCQPVRFSFVMLKAGQEKSPTVVCCSNWENFGAEQFRHLSRLGNGSRNSPKLTCLLLVSSALA